jgi:hypothetical protein
MEVEERCIYFCGVGEREGKRTSITPLIVRWLSLTGAMISCDQLTKVRRMSDARRGRYKLLGKIITTSYPRSCRRH